MAFVICPKHGGLGAAAACPHLANPAAGRAPPLGPWFPVRVAYDGLVLGPTWLCAACAREHGVSEEGLHLTGEAGLERFWAEIGFTPVCPRCLESCRPRSGGSASRRGIRP